jgi:hypothetical protein
MKIYGNRAIITVLDCDDFDLCSGFKKM